MSHEHIPRQRIDSLFEGGRYGGSLCGQIVHFKVDDAIFADDQSEKDASFVGLTVRRLGKLGVLGGGERGGKEGGDMKREGGREEERGSKREKEREREREREREGGGGVETERENRS